jgi:hypothetical protein
MLLSGDDMSQEARDSDLVLRVVADPNGLSVLAVDVSNGWDQTIQQY